MRFGGIMAMNNVSLTLARGARHALIGPNGAGKTTFVNLLAGVLRPSSGRVLLDGEDITTLAQHRRVRRGLARTFQINQLFPALSPLQAVTLALCERDGLAAKWWRPISRHGSVMDEAAGLLRRLGLEAEMRIETRRLAYGKQRLLEIALALALGPRVLLLDEPTAGVPPAESREVFVTLSRLPRDVTVLLIEHNMDLVFRFAERISVLMNGALLVDGTPEDVARDPRVRDVYLGEDFHG